MTPRLDTLFACRANNSRFEELMGRTGLEHEPAEPPAEITCLFPLSLWGAGGLRCHGREAAFAEDFHGGLVEFVAELGALVSLGDVAD